MPRSHTNLLAPALTFLIALAACDKPSSAGDTPNPQYLHAPTHATPVTTTPLDLPATLRSANLRGPHTLIYDAARWHTVAGDVPAPDFDRYNVLIARVRTPTKATPRALASGGRTYILLDEDAFPATDQPNTELRAYRIPLTSGPVYAVGYAEP